MTCLKSHRLLDLLILKSSGREMINLGKGKKKVCGVSSICYLQEWFRAYTY